MQEISHLIGQNLKTGSNATLIEKQEFVYDLDSSTEQLLHNRNFEKLLLDAVDEALGQLGTSAKQTIYLHLEQDFNIRKSCIPFKIEEFTEAVEEIFGTAAALLEIQIMKSLYEKVRCFWIDFPESKSLDFTDYIETIKLSFLNKLG